MLYFFSYESLFGYISKTEIYLKKQPSVILIGGCSRTKKSTLALKLSENFKAIDIMCNIVDLDSWIISIEKREQNSAVIDRYDCDAIVVAVKDILRGDIVFPPLYDPVSRRRIAERGEKFYFVKSGIIIVEGVIALALKELVEIASIKIFSMVSDKVRLASLMDFYVKTKGLGSDTAREIICSREKEEVPFIKRTSRYADLIFRNPL